ncbi:MAG: hypothetical protein NTX28_10210 [Novosphingobium sp.]|nr:hypothetical protein [Novosphingobium sp.]
MATRKKGAAGVAPAAASSAEAPASTEAAAPLILSGEAATGDIQAAIDAAKAGSGEVIFAQQPGQIASVLEAPVLDIGAPEGGVTASTELLADGYPADIELGGRTVMVMARAERGRWRIGRHFTRTPQPVKIDELTEDEVGRLLADPELLVSLDD